MLSRSQRSTLTASGVHGITAHYGRRHLAQVTDLGNIPAEGDKPFRVPLDDDSFESYNFDPPPYYLETTKDHLRQLYHDMLTIRRLEVSADSLYKQKKIRGFCHLSTGQEAVSVGIEHGITRDDLLITAYRSHGNTYMRGASVQSILGELLGRQGGISYGKGGSMHMFRKGFFGGNGIVGASVPVGTGIAMAQQYQESPNITVNLYGDGAANQGQVHEAFNMAKLWELPVLFGCENNQYGMGTSVERASASTDYYKRGQYIPGLRVYGMDVLAVQAAVQHARNYIKSGNGPLVYEFQTYRFAGHSMSDPGVGYRTREELKHKRESDPISMFKEKLIDWKVHTEDELDELEKGVRDTIKQDITEAENMPEPEPNGDTLFQDIYIGHQTSSFSQQIADIQRLVQQTGLKFMMHSTGTTVEGPWDQVMQVIGWAHTLIHQQGIARIQTDVRITTRTDKVQPMEGNVASVERILAAT
ncbi:pyruvate dehydrogenase E1 component alpha subunit, mitochondrial precursor [Paecilomyces variotii No. 5]|uniref:Pyruvate dehydrogenase E1 component subunit alpha n=1 Tax=Byssochlamys spectabilis (strain No. 5 / NBRC 109023) TaxID=1356009 RepID=V5G5E3_BYSSN|nr:pyruvate dehydrogenase E1 component alpha subunit, mitochondrial precursor [Paecilomyces variotii No. 5]